jgi:hypothetical protein
MRVMKNNHFILKNIFFTTLFLFIFTGCADSIESVFNGKVYKKGVEDTNIKYITHKNETVALINATYLNNLNPEQYDDNYHNFLVGLFVANNEKIDLNNERFTVTINEKIFDKVKQIEKTSAVYKKIPILNPHAKYFLISFTKEEDISKVTLDYKYATYNKVSLPFVIK